MANLPTRSDSQGSSLSSSNTSRELSRDELLEQEHERYLRQVSESGIPLWVIDMYGFPLYEVKEQEHPPHGNDRPIQSSTE